jgi:magnesium-transporting ATPase (P-type)
MIKNLRTPFDSADKRMRIYKAVIFVVPFIMCIILLATQITDGVPTEYIDILYKDELIIKDIEKWRNVMMVLLF